MESYIKNKNRDGIKICGGTYFFKTMFTNILFPNFQTKHIVTKLLTTTCKNHSKTKQLKIQTRLNHILKVTSKLSIIT